MSIFEDIIQRLRLLQSVSDVKSSLDESETLIFELCEATIRITELILDPMENAVISYSADDATIVGLMVKQYKGFKKIVEAFESEMFDAEIVYFRINYEAYIKMLYLILEGKEARKEYRLKSYRNRYNEYKEKRDDSISSVFCNKFVADVMADGFSLADFDSVKNWGLGNMSFKGLVTKFQQQELYNILYGVFSDPIHSDWGEIRQLHLKSRERGKYVVSLDGTSFPMQIVSIFISMHLCSLREYMTWHNNESGYSFDDCYFGLVEELHRVTELVCAYYGSLYE